MAGSSPAMPERGARPWRPTRSHLFAAFLAPKKGTGDGGGTSHSPTGSGPEGSSPNEVRIGSLVSLLPVFSSESRKSGTRPALEFVTLFRKPASRDNQLRIDR